MVLKNYTTSVPVEKTIAEIEMLLAYHGATDIWKQYDGTGNVTGINFIIHKGGTEIPFRLPAKVESARNILISEREKGNINISKKKAADINQARRVCWRIIKDWVASQISLIELDMAKIEEIFLPYALVGKNETLFEKMEKNSFVALLAEHKEVNKGEEEAEAVILE